MSLPPFDRVVTEYGQVVLRVCQALLPAHDAEDAAADAFVAALEAYPRLRPDSDVKAWLVTIAHRKAVDILRRKARHAVAYCYVADLAYADVAAVMGTSEAAARQPRREEARRPRVMRDAPPGRVRLRWPDRCPVGRRCGPRSRGRFAAARVIGAGFRLSLFR